MANTTKPAASRNQRQPLAPWQLFLKKWQTLIAYAPFLVFAALYFRVLENAHANAFLISLMVGLPIWAVVVKGYLLYLKYQE